MKLIRLNLLLILSVLGIDTGHAFFECPPLPPGKVSGHSRSWWEGYAKGSGSWNTKVNDDGGKFDIESVKEWFPKEMVIHGESSNRLAFSCEYEGRDKNNNLITITHTIMANSKSPYKNQRASHKKTHKGKNPRMAGTATDEGIYADTLATQFIFNPNYYHFQSNSMCGVRRSPNGTVTCTPRHPAANKGFSCCIILPRP